MNETLGADRPRVLIAGGTPPWTERVRTALADCPVAIDQAAEGSEALLRLGAGETALVVVETLLGDMSGLAFCRRLRESARGEEPLILMVSSFVDEMDRILAFECGADDFARDPFFPRELAARVQALLRRGRRPQPASDPNETQVGPMRVDFRRSLVELEGAVVPLTWREWELLRLLALERGRVVRRSELIGLLLGTPDAASPRLIDTHVKAIRRKLGGAGALIQTVRGVGYRLAPG